MCVCVCVCVCACVVLCVACLYLYVQLGTKTQLVCIFLTLHFMIPLLLRGKNQWAVKVSTLSGECFWNYIIITVDSEKNLFVQWLYGK